MSDSERIRRALGDVVRSLRRRTGLSQEALGAKADIHRTYVGSVERGERNPTVETLARLLSACEVSWSAFGAALDEQLREVDLEQE